jgi:thermitase
MLLLKRKFLLVGLTLGLIASVGSDPAYALVKKLGLIKDQLPKKSLPVIRNWGLDNDEFASHINARKAWNITKGSKKIVVAVIDTGIDPTHPDLKDNLWKKPGSKDEYGFDFVTNKKNPNDSHGHGTHVSGIVGATAKAGAGASGVSPDVSIMALRYYSETASGADNLSNTIKAINYAVDNGANIINYSGGGAEFSAAEMKAIQRAEAKGILFVAAAGNEYQNTDDPKNKYYPGAYGLTNIITVAATNIRNNLLPSSNWGTQNVHVAAPGENIFSTLPKGRYGYLSGTSQATAFVTGVAALLLAQNDKLTPKELREILMKSTDKLDSLKNKIASAGRINAYAALQQINGTTADNQQNNSNETLATKTTSAIPELAVRSVAIQ